MLANLPGTNDKPRAFEQKVINELIRLKQLKCQEKTAYEKERIRARLKKILKL